MPELGVALPNDEIEAASAAVDALRALKPRFLVCHADMRASAGSLSVRKDQASRRSRSSENRPRDRRSRRGRPERVARARRRGREARGPDHRFDRRLERGRPEILAARRQRPEKPTVEAIATAARAAFPEAKLGGGMLSTFTELNRKRPKAELFDFITHTTCSIVHAADDRSVMETLETLPAIIGSTRAMIGETPYRVGPSAIAARMNPYGKGVLDNPENGAFASPIATLASAACSTRPGRLAMSPPAPMAGCVGRDGRRIRPAWVHSPPCGRPSAALFRFARWAVPSIPRSM